MYWSSSRCDRKLCSYWINTTIENLKWLVKLLAKFSVRGYSQTPTENDIARLLRVGQEKKSMNVGLYRLYVLCTNQKNRSAAWESMQHGHVREPTVILEAIASHDLWIWHAFFGLPRSYNHIIVLQQTMLFEKLPEDEVPKVNCTSFQLLLQLCMLMI